MTEKPDPFPHEGTKQYNLLGALLHGVRVNPLYAIVEFNLPTLQARASELRKRGWPVRTDRERHPKLSNEQWDVYFFDSHFLGWLHANPGRHPFDYEGEDGRGKYVKGA